MMTRLIHSFGEPPMTVRAGNFHRKGEGAPSALPLGYFEVDRSGLGVMTGRGPECTRRSHAVSSVSPRIEAWHGDGTNGGFPRAAVGEDGRSGKASKC